MSPLVVLYKVGLLPATVIRHCCGQEKARRIAELYRLTQYDVVYAYGDTREDEAMLRLATQPYYRWSELID